MKQAAAFFFLMGCAISINSFAQTAYLKSDQIYEGDVAELLIEYRDDTPSMYALDTTALDETFDVISVHPSTKRLEQDGQLVSVMYWKVYLAPKLTGVLKILPINIKQTSTPELTLNVLEKPALNNERIWVEATVEPETFWVGEAATVTLKLKSNRSLLSGFLTDPKIQQSEIIHIGIDQEYEESIKGNQYRVMQRKLLLFASSAGELILPPASFFGEIGAKELKENTELRRHIIRKSDPVKLTVKEPPMHYTGRHWLPMTDLKIKQHWSGLEKDLKTGDSITRRLSLRASGFSAERLPENLFELENNQLVFYPDKVKRDNEFVGDKIVGQLDQSYAIVITGQGTIEIPEISIKWWDVDDDQQKQLIVPGKIIVVSAPDSPPLKDHYFDNTNPNHWVMIALVFFVIFGLLFCLLTKRKNNVTSQFKKKHLKQACQATECATARVRARELLIAWGREQWPDESIVGLNHLTLKINDEVFRDELNNLDKALYAADQPGWQGCQLWNSFVKYRVSTADDNRKQSDLLPALYPVNSLTCKPTLFP